jgi:hypothetical protein
VHLPENALALPVDILMKQRIMDSLRHRKVAEKKKLGLKS